MTVVITDLNLSREALWSAKAIASFLGCSVESVYRWAEMPDVPVYRRGGNYFALKSELWAWLRSSVTGNPENTDLPCGDTEHCSGI